MYSQGTALVTHRIVEVNGNQIVTKGDANNTNDTPIQRNQIVGKVIKVIPNFRMWKESNFNTKSTNTSKCGVTITLGILLI